MLNLAQGHIPMGAECLGESREGVEVRGQLAATYNANGQSWAGLRRPPASAGDLAELVPVKAATLRRAGNGEELTQDLARSLAERSGR